MGVKGLTQSNQSSVKRVFNYAFKHQNQSYRSYQSEQRLHHTSSLTNENSANDGQPARSAGNARDQEAICFSFAFDWLRKWRNHKAKQDKSK